MRCFDNDTACPHPEHLVLDAGSEDEKIKSKKGNKNKKHGKKKTQRGQEGGRKKSSMLACWWTLVPMLLERGRGCSNPLKLSLTPATPTTSVG